MNKVTTNKILLWLVIILLIANAATLSFLWMGRPSARPPGGGAKDFLIKELKLNSNQQQEYQKLIVDHREAAEVLRTKIREAKDVLFEMIKEPNTSDSAKQKQAKEISGYSEELELLTLHHFEKVRTLCTPEQQKKFDDILHQVTSMMGNPRPPMGPEGNRPPGPPPGGPGGPGAE
ncbi:MAG: periplasmic heavy metal sensor [Chitinophagaceae bacterium]|nr:periplasmic heavy metal sensor [Chitinophagaceae bacterium]